MYNYFSSKVNDTFYFTKDNLLPLHLILLNHLLYCNMSDIGCQTDLRTLNNY